MVLKFGLTVSSRMNGSPTPRARSAAGTITDMLHTVIETAAATPPEKEGKRALGKLWIRESVWHEEGKEGSPVPKIASQTPGLAITRTACTTDAAVVAIDMEKMQNKRKRNA